MEILPVSTVHVFVTTKTLRLWVGVALPPGRSDCPENQTEPIRNIRNYNSKDEPFQVNLVRTQ